MELCFIKIIVMRSILPEFPTSLYGVRLRICGDAAAGFRTGLSLAGVGLFRQIA